MTFLQTIRDGVRGCIVGTAVGDALGMAVEGMSRDDIRTQFGRIEGYLDSASRYYKGLKKGSWTDDTKLTVATAEGISEVFSLDPDAMMREVLARYLLAFQDHKRGFGKTTRESLQDRLDGKNPFDGRHMRRPGNGCAMRSAIIGVFSAVIEYLDMESSTFDASSWSQSDFEKLVIETSLLTHNDSRSITAAVVQAHAARDMFFPNVDESNDNLELLNALVCAAEDVEKKLGGESETPRISEVLKRIPSLLDASDELIADVLKTGGAAFESFPTALAYAIKYKNDFRKAVLAGANAGGDTDTIAAMTGALVGTRLGMEAIPEEWRRELEVSDYLVAVADRLWGVIPWLLYNRVP